MKHFLVFLAAACVSAEVVVWTSHCDSKTMAKVDKCVSGIPRINCKTCECAYHRQVAGCYSLCPTDSIEVNKAVDESIAVCDKEFESRVGESEL